jgi:hypothetical protein
MGKSRKQNGSQQEQLLLRTIDNLTERAIPTLANEEARQKLESYLKNASLTIPGAQQEMAEHIKALSLPP